MPSATEDVEDMARAVRKVAKTYARRPPRS